MTSLWHSCLFTLAGHQGEISSVQFNYTGDLALTGSIDRTAKIWNVNTGECLNTLRGHTDEILDVCYNSSGSKLVTASADGAHFVFSSSCDLSSSCKPCRHIQGLQHNDWGMPGHPDWPRGRDLEGVHSISNTSPSSSYRVATNH